METKKCSKCNKELSIDNFNFKNKDKKTRNSYCKICHSKYRKEHYIKNKDKVILQVKKYKENHKEDYKSKKNTQYSKKAGRTIKSVCKRKGCNNITFITKKDLLEDNLRYCSKYCYSKSSRKNVMNYILNKAKRRAKKNNFKFNLTIIFLEELLIKQNNLCAISNIPIKINREREKTIIYETASIDRIDSNKGYVKGNVQFVALGINYMKRNFSNEEAIKMINLILKNNIIPESV